MGEINGMGSEIIKRFLLRWELLNIARRLHFETLLISRKVSVTDCRISSGYHLSFAQLLMWMVCRAWVCRMPFQRPGQQNIEYPTSVLPPGRTSAEPLAGSLSVEFVGPFEGPMSVLEVAGYKKK